MRIWRGIILTEWICSCGTHNTQKFCVNCGKPKPDNDTWQCSCGTVNTTKFCVSCGKARSNIDYSKIETINNTEIKSSPINEFVNTHNEALTEKNTPNNNKTYIITGLLLLVIGLCGIVGYLMFQKNNESVKTTNDIRQSTTEKVPVITENNSSLHNEETDQEIAEIFITQKDLYNQQIAILATDANSHLSRNPSYRNAGHLIERAKQLVGDIRNTRDNVQRTSFKDENFKNQIMRVLDAEFTRADGIREGMQSSHDGGDWHVGFNRGRTGKQQYDEENAVLIRMIR